MSWISEKDFFSDDYGLGKTGEERRLFNDFWDRPKYTKWSDDHEEDYLQYLEIFQREYAKNSKIKIGRLPYSKLLSELDPVKMPVAKAGPIPRAEWDKKMAILTGPESGKEELDVSEFAFKGMPVYLVLEPNPIFNNRDEDRAVINAEGTEVLGRLGDPKFKELFARVKQTEEEEELDEEPPKIPLPPTPRPPPKEKLPTASRRRDCPETPPQPNSSIRNTKTPMRGQNPKRPGWKLPRKPYGHAREVVELEDDLTDAELKKMTSELPRRCLVDAVQDWAKEHEKIVLPSISRADKAEIVATIKEHRIPVPKMSGGGYYGEDDDMSNLFGEGIQNCVDMMEGEGVDDIDDDRFDDFIENERRTTQPFEIAGEGMEGGSIPLDADLYEKAKSEVYPKFKKPSAYRSGALVKRYKELGGRYKDAPDGKRNLKRWFKEDWKDVGNKKGDYPLYRPTKRISKDTPATASEIGDKRLSEQDKLKQKYKGDKNLPKFVGSGDKEDYLAQAKAFAKKAGYTDWDKIKYANDGVHKLELNGVKFGRKGYGDFIEYGMKETPQEASKHRKSYLARATKIPGNWKDDKMSKNNLAIKVLWGGSPFHHLRGGAKQPALPPNVDLVSKDENPVVEEIIEEPMDDGDIRAYYPNATIIKYSDLKNYKTIQQLLPKDKSYVFLLYQHAPNNGHWVLLMRYGKTIEFFCSYGSQIDAPLKWTNPKARQMLGEGVPYLTNLLKAQDEFNAIHNPVQYQSKGTDKATCGAHDVMRLSQMLNHGQDLTDYYDYMSRIKKESGLSYDEIVANFVSQR